MALKGIIWKQYLTCLFHLKHIYRKICPCNDRGPSAGLLGTGDTINLFPPHAWSWYFFNYHLRKLCVWCGVLCCVCVCVYVCAMCLCVLCCAVLCVCVCAVCVCVCYVCVCAVSVCCAVYVTVPMEARREQQSPCSGVTEAENEPWVPWKGNQCSNHWAISPAHNLR